MKKKVHDLPGLGFTVVHWLVQEGLQSNMQPLDVTVSSNITHLVLSFKRKSTTQSVDSRNATLLQLLPTAMCN